MLLVTAGGLRIDYVITREGEAHCGLPGGNALFAAAGARLWAEPVAVWARCGANFPQDWLDALAEFGLLTMGIVRLPDDQDHRTFFAYTADGRRDDTEPRRHFARIGQALPAALEGYVHSTPRQDDPAVFEPLALRAGDWPAAFDQPSAVHLAPQPLATHLQTSAALRQRGTSLITVDPGERYMIPQRADYIRQLLPAVDAFLPSDQEVRSLLGERIALWEAADILADWGAPLVVIKAGAAGVLLLERASGLRRQLPAYHAADDERVIDVTGAGDAFCGGFLAGLAQGVDATMAARMGLVSASMVIEGYGALFALRLSPDAAAARLAALPAG